jgi:hypothetical protein
MGLIVSAASLMTRGCRNEWSFSETAPDTERAMSQENMEIVRSI